MPRIWFPLESSGCPARYAIENANLAHVGLAAAQSSSDFDLERSLEHVLEPGQIRAATQRPLLFLWTAACAQFIQ